MSKKPCKVKVTDVRIPCKAILESGGGVSKQVRKMRALIDAPKQIAVRRTQNAPTKSIREKSILARCEKRKLARREKNKLTR